MPGGRRADAGLNIVKKLCRHSPLGSISAKAPMSASSLEGVADMSERVMSMAVATPSHVTSASTSRRS